MRSIWVRISRIALRNILAVPLLFAITTLPLKAASGVLRIIVRDASTHYAVQAKVAFAGPESLSAQTDGSGSLEVSLPDGQYRVEITAPGYKPIRTRASVTATGALPTGIMLDPVNPPEEEQLLKSSLRAGFTLLHGYAVDERGRPVPDVRVRLLHDGSETTTNERGYYELSVETPTETGPDIPGTDTLIAQKQGYKTIIHRNIIVAGEDGGGWFLDIEKGKGTTEFDDTHKLMRQGGTPQQQIYAAPATHVLRAPSPELYRWLGTSGAALGAGSAQVATSPLTITVPTSIIVGLSCTNPNKMSTCTTCSWASCNAWNTYSLEDYVQIGLGQEWIPSWDPDSLMAGAVAYRSYGGYYVQSGNPYTNNFDICSSTACQAFNPNYTPGAAVKNAQSATAGVVLSADKVNIFKAEYAAESNLASDTAYATCPDGQVGEPAYGWPCMKDPLCLGASQANTHSRGMCQWGSQRWATGTNASGAVVTKPRDWRCILDHYYNANSNSITVDPSGTGSPGAGTQERTAFQQSQPPYGQIAYEAYDSNGAITGIRAASAADGSGDYSIVPGVAFEPSWEPGGKRLAFYNSTGITVINADGTGLTQITSNGCPTQNAKTCDFSPAWSPFSSRIAFCSIRSGTTQVYVVNADGSNLQQVPTNVQLQDSGTVVASNPGYEEEDCDLTWSPDEKKITLTGITAVIQNANRYNVYTMNAADGSGLTELTNCIANYPGFPTPSVCGTPAWSPDGMRIAFSDWDGQAGDNIGGSGIYTMNSDGSGLTQLIQITPNTSRHTSFPRYSTDGGKIFYTDSLGGYWGGWSMNPDGTQPTLILGGSKNSMYFLPGAIDCSVCQNFGSL